MNFSFNKDQRRKKKIEKKWKKQKIGRHFDKFKIKQMK